MKLLDKLVNTLGLVLDDSEIIELQKIDKATQLAPSTPPIYMLIRGHQYKHYLEKRREKTVHTYRLRREAKEVLDNALASNGDQYLWNKAYRMAEITASSELSLLNLRFNDIKTQTYLLMIGIQFTRVLSHLVEWMWPHLNIRPSESSARDVLLVFTFLEMACLLLKDFNYFSCHSIEAVLNEAQGAGIKFDSTIGELLADDTSLIYQLINIENNEKKLEGLQNVQIPDNFCCPITCGIMTDPVGSVRSQHRFERTFILEWLKKQSINPLTRLPLFPDELRRDFKLKRDIDSFIDNECLANTHQQIKTPLIQLSLFQPISEDEEMTLGVSRPARSLLQASPQSRTCRTTASGSQ